MCEFPYYLNNSTCILYAHNDINKYHDIQISFCFFSSLGILLSMILGYFTYKEKNNLSARQLMYFGLGTSFLLLLLQFIDPFGYGGWMPHLGDVLLSNISTWISLSLVFAIFITLTKVFNNIEYDSTKLIPYYMLLLTTLVITLICSFFQVIYDRYIWRGIKLILYSLFISLVSYKILKYLHRIYKYLNYDNSDEIKERLKLVSIIFSLFISTIVILQLYLGIESIVNHTYIDPHITWKQLLLPIFHIMSNYFGMFYFLGTNKYRKEYIKSILRDYCGLFKINIQEYDDNYDDTLSESNLVIV